jgi:cytoskeletal protein RodZ
MRNERRGSRRLHQAINRRKLRTKYARYASRTQSARQTDAQPTSEVAPATASAIATPSIANRIKKAKEMITAKLANPASIKFPDIEPGRATDSVCGEAEVKGAGETREMPFAVQKNEVYLINGSDDLNASRQ